MTNLKEYKQPPNRYQRGRKSNIDWG